VITLNHIILAAGKGTRMKHHTTTRAKGMINFGGLPLLVRQLHIIQKNGPDCIFIVRGYRADDIYFPNMYNVKYFTNTKYCSTNMIESLMCARPCFFKDTVVSYADILYNYDMLQAISNTEEDFVVAVDVNWEYYWKIRYGKIDTDTESLKINDYGLITNIGKPNPSLEEIDGRYVGLLKFSKKGLKIIEEIYDSDEKWKTAYMTDLLQEIINRGHKVYPLEVWNGWIEFDTVDDYKKNKRWLERDQLSHLLNLKL